MRLIISLFFLSTSFNFCNIKKTEKSIVINGNISGIPSEKIYLIDIITSKPLDSSTTEKGAFSFHPKMNKDFEPKLVGIKFYDSTGNKLQLTYRNIFAKPAGGTNTFMLEDGITTISGTITGFEFNSTNQMNIKSGNETVTQFKYERSNFGEVTTKDTANRSKLIHSYKKIINENSHSHFLVQRLFRNKKSYTNTELMELITAFDQKVQGSKYAKEMKSYLENRSAVGEPLSNFLLLNSKSAREHIIDTNTNINMIIFWASWCVPCRQEIPQLKLVRRSFSRQELNMVSISIDANYTTWQNAVVQEKMNWSQLITDSISDSKIKAKYDFSSIPVIYFTDEKGNLIRRFDGYNETAITNYFTLIKQQLSKK